MKCMKKILSDVKEDLNKLTDLFLVNNIDTNSKKDSTGFQYPPQIHVLPESSGVILLGNRATEDVINEDEGIPDQGVSLPKMTGVLREGIRKTGRAPCDGRGEDWNLESTSQ